MFFNNLPLLMSIPLFLHMVQDQRRWSSEDRLTKTQTLHAPLKKLAMSDNKTFTDFIKRLDANSQHIVLQSLRIVQTEFAAQQGSRRLTTGQLISWSTHDTPDEEKQAPGLPTKPLRTPTTNRRSFA